MDDVEVSWDQLKSRAEICNSVLKHFLRKGHHSNLCNQQCGQYDLVHHDGGAVKVTIIYP